MLRLATVVALAACSSLAFAQDRRPDYGPDVNTATAKKIAAGVIAECQKNGWNVAVAVVDNHGGLVYFERMENTQYASNDIAINKGGPAIATLGGGLTASPGGVPIMVDGKVTGGVGVSGVTGDQDEQCAKAGLGMK